VRAIDTAGNLGPYSNIASATTVSTAVIAFVHANNAVPQWADQRRSEFHRPQGSGDLNVVVVGCDDTTATVSTVTDSSGNVYQLAIGPTVVSGTASQAIYYAPNLEGASVDGNKREVTFTPAAQYPDVRFLEYRGIDTNSPLDVSVGTSGGSTSASSGSVTTTYANDLVIARTAC
jgi:hypothetical protein